MEVLPKFNPAKKTSLYTFLYIHVRNRLITLKRDKYSRHILPCNNCRHYEESECILYDEESQCPRYTKWITLNSAKRNLVSPSDITDCTDNSYEVDLTDEIIKKEFLEYIDKYLSKNLRQDYLRWREGTKIPSHRNKKIEEEIKRILAMKGFVANDQQETGSP